MNNISLINIQSLTHNNLQYNVNELRNYLGIRSNDQYEELIPKIDFLSEQILKASRPKACWCVVNLMNITDGFLQLSNLSVKSYDLSKNLLNCEFAIIFCATLGVGVDRLIKKQLAKSSSDGVIANAIASAYIEGYCDILNRQYKEKYGLLQPRYSCGYGDFDISFQKEFLKILNAEKNIGVYCTEKFLLTPSKSVTAVVGLRKG